MDVLDGKMLYEEDDTFEDDGEEWNEDWVSPVIKKILNINLSNS